MCRKNQLIAAAAAAFGLGLLVATCFESMLLCGCIGVVLIAIGVLFWGRK